jgi:hypothetical protein
VDVNLVFAGLAARAATLSSAGNPLTALDSMRDAITPPVFFPVDIEIDFDKTFQRGLDDWLVTCRLLVSKADDRSGLAKLAAYMKGSGPLSVKAAIEAEKTLGGACHALHVKTVRGYGKYEHQGNNFYGADWIVRVIGAGD